MTDFEPNYFPPLEFDRPDFPGFYPGSGGWRAAPATVDLFDRRPSGSSHAQNQPAAAAASDHLRWKTCLTSTSRGPGPTPRSWRNNARRPILHRAPRCSRFSTTTPGTHAPRLLAPRRLDPNTAYYACLVPTPRRGKKAGLGEPIKPEDEQALKPVWGKTPRPRHAAGFSSGSFGQASRGFRIACAPIESSVPCRLGGLTAGGHSHTWLGHAHPGAGRSRVAC